jgi:predicted nucleic acid-binding protein
MKQLVIDSSVFNKLYLEEPDSDQALALFARATQREFELQAPDLLYLEVISTANSYQIPIDFVVQLLDFQTRYLLPLRPLTRAEMRKAIEITQQGHPQSGYPSIYDSVFHAMAMCTGATLVTADRRHYEKTRQLGNVVQLKDMLTQ